MNSKDGTRTYNYPDKTTKESMLDTENFPEKNEICTCAYVYWGRGSHVLLSE